MNQLDKKIEKKYSGKGFNYYKERFAEFLAPNTQLYFTNFYSVLIPTTTCDKTELSGGKETNKTSEVNSKSKEIKDKSETIEKIDNIEFKDTFLLEIETELSGILSKPLLRRVNPICTVLHTSGTSADKAKAIPLTNDQVISAIGMYYDVFYDFRDHFDKTGKNKYYLSFLPPMHALEYICSYVFPSLQVGIGFGSPKTLFCSTTKTLDGENRGDIKAFSPSLLIVVPLLLSRVKNGMEDKIRNASQFKYSLYKTLYSMKASVNSSEKSILSYLNIFDWVSKLTDYLVFNKIKSLFGGLELVVCGSAALEDSMKEWTRNVLGVNFVEGWGMTETTACGILDVLFKQKIKNSFTGVPIGNIRARISKDWLTSEYIEGDLFISTPTAPSSYLSYNDEEIPIKNSEGFIDTGDRAQVFLSGKNKGCIKIVGRKKEIVKLSNGEFYNLIHYENFYSELKGTEKVMVCIEPTSERPRLLINSASLRDESKEDAEKILKNIWEIEEKYKIPKNIRIRRFKVIETAWTAENGCLTPSMKLRRFKVKEIFKIEYDELMK